jgi:hypothetical protein
VFHRASFKRGSSSAVILLLTNLLSLGTPANAQDPQAPAGEPRPIQDNSFLHEEAYNQEPGVMQHISVFTHFWESESWAYGFTQEWPLGGMRHQGSFTLAVVRPGSFVDPGFGDLLLNYRLQALGGGDARWSFSPRLSLLIPTGDSKSGRGLGGAGVQVNLPLSVVVHDNLVVHANAGTTLVPRAKNESDERAFTSGFNVSQSFIWLAHPRFNVLLETIWNGVETVTAPDRTERSNEVFLAPGIRWAYNFRNGLQIVPGVGMAAGVGPSAGERGLVLYLSFEHPFTRSASD